MTGLTTALLQQACQVFFSLAYSPNPDSVPPKKRLYLNIPPEKPLSSLLPPVAPPDICQAVPDPNGGVRGYAFRLGSSRFPHLKLQVVRCEQGPECVFSVDTHDAVSLP